MLTDLKQHPIQEVQGQLFGMSPSHANKGIHLLHAVLNQTFAHQEWLPARTADDLAAWLAAERTPGMPTPPPFWQDGTERPLHRPTDPEEQQAYSSGKQKCHPVKNLLVIGESCHVGFLSDTYEGKAH